MVAATTSLETLCISSIRMLAVDAINKSNSGHPGLPMGCAPMGFTLWDKFLKHNPKNHNYLNDRATILLLLKQRESACQDILKAKLLIKEKEGSNNLIKDQIKVRFHSCRHLVNILVKD